MEVISQLLPYVFVVWTETTLSPLADKRELEVLHNEACHHFYQVKVEPVPFKWSISPGRHMGRWRHNYTTQPLKPGESLRWEREQVRTWRQTEQFLHLTRNESTKNDGHKRGARNFLHYRIHLKITGTKKCDMREIPDWRFINIRNHRTGRAVRGSNPDGGEIFRTCPDRPTQPPIQ